MKGNPAFLLIFSLFSIILRSQSAQDFTVSDLSGQSRNLYQLLAEDKVVILAFFSTQSPNSLTYHNSNQLKQLYAAHGPSGDNRLEILYIESDPATPSSCIQNQSGCNNSVTNINWTSGIPFPIIDNVQLGQMFNISSYPSLTVICPGKKMQQFGPLGANILWEKAEACPVSVTTGSDIGIYYFSTGYKYDQICHNVDLMPSFKIVNLNEVQNINTTVQIKWNDNIVGIVPLNLILNQYQEYSIQVSGFPVSQSGELSISVDPLQGEVNTANNTLSVALADAPVFPDSIMTVRVRTDDYSYETYWDIRDENENLIAFGGNQGVGPNGGGIVVPPTNVGVYPADATAIKNVKLNHNGCYSFNLVDALGDGFICAPNVPCGVKLYGPSYSVEQPFWWIKNFKDYKRLYFSVYNAALPSPTSEPVTGFSVRLSPNPTAEQLDVTLEAQEPEELAADIFSFSGQLMIKGGLIQVLPGENRYVYQVSDLPAGIYFLRIQGKNGLTTARFVKN